MLQIFKDCSAIITDSHIVYTSGRHGAVYINKDAVYPYTKKIQELCEIIATHFYYPVGSFIKVVDIEVVVAPAIGGVILSQWVADHLTYLKGRQVFSVYAEKIGDKNFIIKRGYDKLIPGKSVLVVEDILTTGASAKKVVELTRAIGGNVVGLGVLCNRGGITPKDVGDVPELFALINIELDSWDEKDCPLCEQKIPINTDVGKGREFLKRKFLAREVK
ncbi:MAG TPA: phosphoribosyltransferase [Candidatus Wolfebacteria bacterium]|nr:phosphoribosyltransferase [Candidatus Wolfebacteria bacterium]